MRRNRYSSERHRKIRRFGLLGALGCLIGALLGEVFLWWMPAPAPPDRVICLLIDCSGSMRQDRKLEEVKRAALQFVRRQDMRRSRIAVVAFAGGADLVVPLTRNVGDLEMAIASLDRYNGSTRVDAGLMVAEAELRDVPGARNILLFTDGQPDSQADAVRMARLLRDQGVRLVAVATQDAPQAQLAQLTGDPGLIFPTTAGQFGIAFASAERAISGPQLMESAPIAGEYSFGERLLRLGGWTAMLTLGLALFLIGAQNRYLRQPLLDPHQAMFAVSGSIVAGLVAALVGELVFQAPAEAPLLSDALRVLSWALLGALIGLGMAFFVPNLPHHRAVLGGMIGGALGALGFLAANNFGDLAGRLVGAALLGLLIGLMIAMVEYLYSRPAVGPERIRLRNSTAARKLRWG